MAKPLTAVTVAKARAHPTRREIPDPGCRGLYLVVQPSGVKSWVARYRSRGRSVKFTIGPVLAGVRAEAAETPQLGVPMSLAAAREMCAKALREARAGRDLADERRRAREQEHAGKADTFEAVAEEFLRREGPRLRTLGQRRSDLELLYKPVGQEPMDLIRRALFVREFDRIADQRGPVRANRVQSAVKALLNWHAARSDYVSVLTRTPQRISIAERARSHVPTDAELRAIVLAAEHDEGTFGRYLLFTLLTAARRSESAALHRNEISSDGRIWIIPGSRYKNGNDTLIPLSERAQAIVRSLEPEGDYLFGTNGRRPLCDFSRRKKEFDEACGVSNWRLHDLRRAARTLLSRAGVNPDVAERCLGHTLVGVRKVYDRHAFQSEKAAAFEALAQQVEIITRPPPATTVVPIRLGRCK
jgi:integrase